MTTIKEETYNDYPGLNPVEKEIYKQYEELILTRDELRALSERYLNEYVATFGQLINDVYFRKIECIRLKKMISFAQSYVNRGLPVDKAVMNSYIEAQMETYYSHLKELEENYKNSQKVRGISELEVIRIKKLYRKLAKLIHPDMNPSLADNETIRDLWNRIVAAYNCNNYKELIELEVLVNKVLSENNIKPEDIDIPDIEAKIAELNEEIRMIREQDILPYKTILEDEEAVITKKDQLTEELKQYQTYKQQLEEELAQFNLDEGGALA